MVIKEREFKMRRNKSHIDPRILRTRKLLRDAFVELLQEMDVDKITVNRLAERATINRVTFYLHYRDIPDMMEKMAADMTEEIKSVLNHKLKDGKEVVNLLEHIAENADFYKIILTSKVVPIFRESLTVLLRDRIVSELDKKQGESPILKAGIKKDVLIWYNTSALIGLIISWLQNDMPYTPAFLADQFFLLQDRTILLKDEEK